MSFQNFGGSVPSQAHAQGVAQSLVRDVQEAANPCFDLTSMSLSFPLSLNINLKMLKKKQYNFTSNYLRHGHMGTQTHRGFSMQHCVLTVKNCKQCTESHIPRNLHILGNLQS